MKTGKQIQTKRTTVGLNGRLSLKIGIIVAAVAGCLLAVPLTRAHKHMDCEQPARGSPNTQPGRYVFMRYI